MASFSPELDTYYVIDNEALMTDLILTKIFSLLSFRELKACHLVCKRWSEFARSHLFKRSVVKFGVIHLDDCELRRPQKVPEGVLSSSATKDGMDNRKKAQDFLKCLNAWDSDSSIVFKKLTIWASLVAEFAGDLILHPSMRDGITILDITLYPVQLEWLRAVIQDLKNLKELKVTATNTDTCRDPSPSSPPPEFPKKYLGLDGQVPPTLGFPDEYLLGYRNIKNDLGIETLILHTLKNASPRARELESEALEYLQTCLVNEDDCSLSSWILPRAPKLKNIHFVSDMCIDFEEIINRISRDYRGPGFKSVILSAFCGGLDVHDANARALLTYFDKCCFNTLEELILKNLRISFQLILSSTLFPASTLTKLSITEMAVILNDTDFDWILHANLTYSLKVKDGRLGEADYLQMFPQIHNLNVLRYLYLRMQVEIQWTGFNRYRCQIKRFRPRRIYARTLRVFPNVKSLDLDFDLCPLDMFVHVVHDFEACFPNLKILSLGSEMSRLNKYLLAMPAQLEAITLHGFPERYSPTDEDFLRKNSILRFTQLTHFCLSNTDTNLTDGVIINGFLKLPKLCFLSLSISDEGNLTPFGEVALKELKWKMCTLELKARQSCSKRKRNYSRHE